MEPLMKVSGDNLAEAVASDTPGPAVINGDELMMLVALAGRASLLASKVEDPTAAEAIRLLSLALHRTGGLLADFISAMHHGAVGVVNYPEAIDAFPGIKWRVESREGRIHEIEKEPVDPRPFLDDEGLAFLKNTQPWIFERFEGEQQAGT